MKIHRTMTVTEKTLGRMRACPSGREDIAPLLPLKISTDPEQNIDLAIELVQRNAVMHVDWFNDRCAGRITSLEYCDDDRHWTKQAKRPLAKDGVYYDTHVYRDVPLVAQWLAHAADKYLTRKGR